VHQTVFNLTIGKDRARLQPDLAELFAGPSTHKLAKEQPEKAALAGRSSIQIFLVTVR